MLHKLFFITCLLTGINTFAQKGLVPMYIPSATPQAVTDDGDKSDFTKMGAALPKFRIVTLPQGTITKVNGKEVKKVVVQKKNITDKDVKNNANLVVMVFNPVCGHCEDQTDSLTKHIRLFKKSKLVMIAAPSMGTYLEQFERNHHTNKYPTMQIGLDSSALIRKLYLYKDMPQINIYNKERKLIRTFVGGATIDTLKRYIQ